MGSSIHQYVLTQLEETKGRWPRVARGSGVSYRTIKKIASRESKHPRIDTLEILATYFRDREVARNRIAS